MDNIQQAAPSRDKVWHMFDRIATRYDLLNHLLSFGMDIYWRSRLRKHIPDHKEQYLLDIATGTGDQVISLMKDPRISNAVGIDLATKMLKIGQKKIIDRNLSDHVEFEEGDACDLQFPGNKFDLLTMSFGIRNVINLNKALNEMYRVLKNEGRILILEFSLPANLIFRKLYLFYFRHILPKIGSLISGDGYAYRYLNETVETFPFGEDFCKLLSKTGFENPRAIPLTFGVATIYVADKPD